MGKELGMRISGLLKSRNMPQKELALRMGITEASMSRYISGDRDPKPAMLARIATELNTTTDYLIGMETRSADRLNYSQIIRLVEENAAIMTNEEKKQIVNALFMDK